MTKKFLLLFLMSLVAGCETMGQMGGGAPPPCGTHVCSVQITVTGSCSFSANPYYLPIAAENKNMVIQWDLTGATFTSEQDGIFIKDPYPKGEFHGFARAGGGNTFTIVNTHSVVGKPYRYGVRVIQNGTLCPAYDPTIMN